MIGLLGWVKTPLPNDVVQMPVGTLRRDLQLILGRTIAALIQSGFLLGWIAGLVHGSVVVLALGFEGAFAVLAAFGRIRWTETASSVYLCSLFILRTQRRVPWQMMRFVDDAHWIGQLRRIGPVYQFRHAKLQDRLTHTYRRDART